MKLLWNLGKTQNDKDGKKAIILSPATQYYQPLTLWYFSLNLGTVLAGRGCQWSRDNLVLKLNWFTEYVIFNTVLFFHLKLYHRLRFTLLKFPKHNFNSFFGFSTWVLLTFSHSCGHLEISLAHTSKPDSPFSHFLELMQSVTCAIPNLCVNLEWPCAPSWFHQYAKASESQASSFTACGKPFYEWIVHVPD